MVKRYLQFLEFLDVEDDDIMDVMPAPAVTKRMRSLFKELKDVESVSKALQGRDVDLLDVRQWFGDLIVIKPQYAHYLGKHKTRDSNEHTKPFCGVETQLGMDLPVAAEVPTGDKLPGYGLRDSLATVWLISTGSDVSESTHRVT
ncbi:unnamed protein product [Phytophthora lilii]|uniref:Unnamed protein product n=1 Tax=Phytophthora lilii TaxID=2077276 RepID=A0A9W6TZL9_9STRA|nr:unnamed protein product [Phytophthora lilii]